MLPHASEQAGRGVILGSYVPVPLAEAVRGLAERNDRSVSGEVRVAIKEHLAASSSPPSDESA